MFYFTVALISLGFAVPQLVAGDAGYHGEDADLERFVSRPDLRPPKFVVEMLDYTAVTKGFWFVATNAPDLNDGKRSRTYQTHQVGPHIYDNNGQLIWSGAELFPQRNAYDFKVSQGDGRSQLTFLLKEQAHDIKHIGGAGIVLDENYQITDRVRVVRGEGTFNMHEFTVLDGGKTALLFVHERRLFETDKPRFHKWILDVGFIEIDIQTNEIVFEWWVAEHVHPLQSTIQIPRDSRSRKFPFDFFHINSIDKDRNGDYLVSGRHMNTVYKISGVDGSIIWQLGGKNSSFKHDEFIFSSQHHARFISKNETTTTISVFNNASNGRTRTAPTSSGLIIALDTSQSPMTARIVRKFDRPDGKHTTFRGDIQVLSNSNTVVGWSENSYISEFTKDGRLVLEAHFLTRRLATYRSFKFNFTGVPLQPPDLVCSAYGVSLSSANTACYVSWNGATEVDSWNFYAVGKDGDLETLLGNGARQGFETIFISAGYSPIVFAEALDVQGHSLRNSSSTLTKVAQENGFSEIEDSSTFHPHKNHHAGHSRNGADHGFRSKFAGIPDLWSLIICFLLGAVSAMAITRASSMLWRFLSRRHEEKGYIRGNNLGNFPT